MAARYTTGPKWGALSDQAQALADELDRSAADCLRLAESLIRREAAIPAPPGNLHRKSILQNSQLAALKSVVHLLLHGFRDAA
jgi:hypothetical protein